MEALTTDETALATVMLHPEAWTVLVERDVLTRTEWRLLMGLVAHVRPGNLVTLSVANLARTLVIPYAGALKAWHTLCDAELLTPVFSSLGTLEGYRLSPSLCWRGRPHRAAFARAAERAEQGLKHTARRG